jgi:hypothetical protein
MKSVRTFVPALLAVGGLAAGHLASRPALEARASANQDLAERVRALESELATVEAQLATVAADAAEQRRLLDQTVTYLGRQASQAEAMIGVLAESEERGFTAGINPKSREVLLAGFRALMKEAQQGLPGEQQGEQQAAGGRRR